MAGAAVAAPILMGPSWIIERLQSRGVLAGRPVATAALTLLLLGVAIQVCGPGRAGGGLRVSLQAHELTDLNAGLCAAGVRTFPPDGACARR